jgi:hypothetical protein
LGAAKLAVKVREAQGSTIKKSRNLLKGIPALPLTRRRKEYVDYTIVAAKNSKHDHNSDSASPNWASFSE